MAIRNVPKTYTFEEQRQEINLLGADTGDTASLTTSTKIVVSAINAILDGSEPFDNLTITGDLTVQGGDIVISNSATKLSIRDNTSSSLSIAEGANVYLSIDTTNSTEKINLLKPVSITGDVSISGDLTVTGSDIKSSTATALTLSGSDVSIAGDLTVTGNDIKSSTATALTLSGANVTVAGTLDVTSNFEVNTDKFVVTASTGNTLIAGTLDVTSNFEVNTDKFVVSASSGNTSVAGTLSSVGNFSVNTNKFVVTSSSGNTSIAGTLGVTGNTTLTGNLNINSGEINLTGATNSSSLLIKDNLASAFAIKEGTTSYLSLDTSNSAEKITLHKDTDILGTITNSQTLGALTDLITDSKTTFVSAINEVKDDALIYAMLFG